MIFRVHDSRGGISDEMRLRMPGARKVMAAEQLLELASSYEDTLMWMDTIVVVLQGNPPSPSTKRSPCLITQSFG